MLEAPNGTTSLPSLTPISCTPVRHAVKYLKSSQEGPRTPSPTLYPPPAEAAKKEVNEARAEKLLEKYKNFPREEITLQQFLATFVSIEQMDRIRVVASAHIQKALTLVSENINIPTKWPQFFDIQFGFIFDEKAQAVFSIMRRVLIQQLETEADLIKHRESRFKSLSEVIETFFLTTLNEENWMQLTSKVVHEKSDLIFRRIENETTPHIDELVPYDKSRHRYHDVLPYKDNVVKDVASPMWLYGQLYLVTHAPLPVDFENFWELIYQEGVEAVVCLAQPVENGKRQVDPYWEQKGCQEKVTVFQDPSGESIIKCVFNISKNPHIPKEVSLFLCTGWLDGKVPRRLIRPLIDCTQKIEGPILVHCSAGVGRSGVFIAVDSEIRRIKKEQKAGKKNDQITLSFPSTNLRMRINRPFMVRTRQQYAIVSHIVYEYFSSNSNLPGSSTK